MAPTRQQVCQRTLICLSTIQAINEIKHVKNKLFKIYYEVECTIHPITMKNQQYNILNLLRVNN